MSAPTNMDDVIDSRDVIERIEELQGERDAFVDEVGADSERNDVQTADARLTWAEQNPDEAAELAALEALAEEASAYAADWQHGETLIRDSYFKEYAQELAEDIGAINANASWPNNCIDWDQAARELQMDYTSVNFDNVIYWVR